MKLIKKKDLQNDFERFMKLLQDNWYIIFLLHQFPIQKDCVLNTALSSKKILQCGATQNLLHEILISGLNKNKSDNTIQEKHILSVVSVYGSLNGCMVGDHIFIHCSFTHNEKIYYYLLQSYYSAYSFSGLYGFVELTEEENKIYNDSFVELKKYQYRPYINCECIKALKYIMSMFTGVDYNRHGDDMRMRPERLSVTTTSYNFNSISELEKNVNSRLTLKINDVIPILPDTKKAFNLKLYFYDAILNYDELKNFLNVSPDELGSLFIGIPTEFQKSWREIYTNNGFKMIEINIELSGILKTEVCYLCTKLICDIGICKNLGITPIDLYNTSIKSKSNLYNKNQYNILKYIINTTVKYDNFCTQQYN